MVILKRFAELAWVQVAELCWNAYFILVVICSEKTATEADKADQANTKNRQRVADPLDFIKLYGLSTSNSKILFPLLHECGCQQAMWV